MNRGSSSIELICFRSLLMPWCQMMSLPQFGKCLILSSGRTISGNLVGTQRRNSWIFSRLWWKYSGRFDRTAPSQNILLWPSADCPHLPQNISPRPQLISRVTSKEAEQVQVFIYRAANRAVAISIYMDCARPYVWRGCSHKYQTSFQISLGSRDKGEMSIGVLPKILPHLIALLFFTCKKVKYHNISGSIQTNPSLSS